MARENEITPMTTSPWILAGSGRPGDPTYRPPAPADPNDWFHNPTNPNAGFYNAFPWMPQYQQGYDAETMATLPGVEAMLGKINFDTRGLEAFRQNALRKGDSPWAALAVQKQLQEEGIARDRAKQESAGATAKAESELAMRGGLSSGARERLATSGARTSMAMGQDIGRQGTLNRMGIGIQDESNRIAQLSQLPGMENIAFQAGMQKASAWDKAKNQDIQRLIDENNRRNTYNMGIYENQMNAAAAAETARQQEEVGKKD